MDIDEAQHKHSDRNHMNEAKHKLNALNGSQIDYSWEKQQDARNVEETSNTDMINCSRTLTHQQKQTKTSLQHQQTFKTTDQH